MRKLIGKTIAKTLVSFGLLAGLFPAHADTVFNYDGFYSRMKKSEKAEYSDITLSFLLQKAGSTERCVIDSAAITTDISSEPLTFATNGELILPYDELLNNRKALILLKQQPDAVACDLNFRLRSRMPLEQRITLAQLHKTHQQFQGLLADLAGLGKYFLPEMTGVTVLFAGDAVVQDVSPLLQSRVKCEGKQCHINLIGLDSAQTATIYFNLTPEYLVPLLQR